jgi:repressor LexA
VNIPIIGNVAAGQPILAEQNIEGYYPIPAEFIPNKPTFILNVHGDSMINAGILNGDQLICTVENTAENGQIVVALIDDSATVKRFYREKGHIRLQPENDFMDPIIVSDVKIMGRAIGLLRLAL